MQKDKILVIGACGQLGTELTHELMNVFGDGNVFASDIRKEKEIGHLFDPKIYFQLNVLDGKKLFELIKQQKITQIYHLAAYLSASGENNPDAAWELNMDGLFNVLDAARDLKLKKIYWPSSIAVFGPHTPREKTPQHCVMDPGTIYGISKLAGERYCEYFHKRYNVDVRSLRYPGLIGWKSAPGGGTTDYAVTIYHEALKTHKFECFLKQNTELPMLYMPDALRATIDLMEAPSEKIKIRSSYNLAGMSFTPKEIADSIKVHIKDFKITYKPDFRQAIADSWPKSIDDKVARKEWGWKPEYNLKKMTQQKLMNLGRELGVEKG
jgi:nucleoside-diphosphate-sugar epimerase